MFILGLGIQKVIHHRDDRVAFSISVICVVLGKMASLDADRGRISNPAIWNHP